ncbi:MAG TPA: hypothetical protein VFJ85_07880 [Acidimicrobiales bacterium]|nr:hypothetical protein [Acidimicrobiales bacterium]
MDDTSITTQEAADRPVPGCTCCKPPAVTAEDEAEQLRARWESVQRRLAVLEGAVR